MDEQNSENHQQPTNQPTGRYHPPVQQAPIPQPMPPLPPQPIAPQPPDPQTWQTQAPPAPLTQPVANSAPPTDESNNNAVSIVLQWLSYGLWEWMLGTLSVLLSVTLSYFFISSTRSNDYGWISYLVATMIVLLPFAFVLDRLYSKKEPDHKHGFAAVVMVINAVIVFLAAIGGLITFVVSIMTLFLNANPSSTTNIVIISSLVVSILSLMLFLRIMHFPKLHKFSRLFPLIIVFIAGVTAFLAIAGPFRGEVSSKVDRLIENNLSTLNDRIQSYGQKNKKLPSSLSDLDFDNNYYKDAKSLIDKNLVEYTAKTISSTNYSPTTGTTTTTYKSPSSNKPSSNKLSYELCVTYKKARNESSGYDYGDGSYSSSYLNTMSHGAGRKCYSQSVTVYTY